MPITENDRLFLLSRARRVRAWRSVGPLLVGGLAGLAGWLILFVPLLANPVIVLSRLEDDSIPVSTMALSAAMVPILVLLCLLLTLALVLFAFVAFAHERRYLAIIERSTAPSLKTSADARDPE